MADFHWSMYIKKNLHFILWRFNHSAVCFSNRSPLGEWFKVEFYKFRSKESINHRLQTVKFSEPLRFCLKRNAICFWILQILMEKVNWVLGSAKFHPAWMGILRAAAQWDLRLLQCNFICLSFKKLCLSEILDPET